MFTEWLRKLSKWLVIPVSGFLARIGLSANALTIIGCLLNVAVAAILASGWLRLGGLLLIVAAGFDALDGTLARQTGQATRFGAFLDSVLDRVSESALLVGLAWWYMQQGRSLEVILAYVAVVGSLLVSYTRARAEGLGVECKVGFFTRVERALVLIIALLVGVTPWALWILAIGTFLTTVQRIWEVYSKTKGQLLG